jgi:hypothetical protein
MKPTLLLPVVAAWLAGSLAMDAWARGGSGIGGTRLPAGATSRPAAAANVARTPSLSRTPGTPSISRPTPSITRPAIQEGRPTVDSGRPSLGGVRPDLGAVRPSGVQRPNGPVERPTPGQLQDFLDLPGRPAVSTRPTVPERPKAIERPGISERPGIGERVPAGREDRIDAIRERWNRPIAERPFDRDWWVRHQKPVVHWHWHTGWNRYPASWWWRGSTWSALTGWFVWSWTNPYHYGYGTTVVYRDNDIYVNNRQVATIEAYHEQAIRIAQNVPEDLDGEQIEWMPLGVFAISEASGADQGMLIQLAVSREGVISGAFYNEITDSVRPLVGSVDSTSQRAAWRFADEEDCEIIMETGIYNLTQEESTALVHFGSGKVQTWVLVRLHEPEEEATGAQPE